jgi:membrane protein required for colicin V production
MSWLDIVFLVIIGLSGFRGLRAGLIHSVVSLLGVIFGVYISVRYYSVGADWLIAHTSWAPNVSRVLVFVISFFLILTLMKLLFWLFERFVAVITVLPLMTTVDKVLGLVFGVLSAALSLGVMVYFIERFPLGSSFMGILATSEIAPVLSIMAGVLVPLFPEALRLLKSSVDYVEGVVRP